MASQLSSFSGTSLTSPDGSVRAGSQCRDGGALIGLIVD
jgi:hypothetical protein